MVMVMVMVAVDQSGLEKNSFSMVEIFPEAAITI
jgi:hypothetical protein